MEVDARGQIKALVGDEPAVDGKDVVLTIDRGQSVLGHRQHGVYYAGHVYLFADEATLK